MPIIGSIQHLSGSNATGDGEFFGDGDGQYHGIILDGQHIASNGISHSGSLYYLKSDETWAHAGASNTTTGGGSLLGVALDHSTQNTKMLLRGMIRVDESLWTASPNKGAPIYISDTVTGSFDGTAPDGNGEVVRIVGYCIDKKMGNSGFDILMYFCPDNTWIEITA